MTMTLIATTTLASNASSIDFTAIAGSFTDLKIVASIRDTYSGSNGWREMNIQFNGVTTNRSFRSLYGTGSGAGSDNSTAIYGWTSPSNTTANTFGNLEIYIPNYAGATNKSVSVDGVTENNATSAFCFIEAGLWSSTAAITQVSLVAITNQFAAGSTASIYGITKGSGGASVSP